MLKKNNTWHRKTGTSYFDRLREKSNSESSDEFLKKKKEVSPAEALKRLAALCARGEHSTGEADEKMRHWGLSEADRAQIIQKLVDNKFIDDERFAKYFVHDKIKFNHWGRRKIEIALRQKGIADETKNEVLDSIPDEEYLEILRPMINDKMAKTTGKSDYERAMKTIKWALGRGFSLDLIHQCIDEEAQDDEC